MFDEETIRLIEAMPDRDTILNTWIKLLVQAGKTNANGFIFLNDKIPYTDEMLSTIFNRPLNTIRLALGIFKQFEMIEMTKNGIAIKNWEKHQNVEGMVRLKLQWKEASKKYREKQKELNHMTSYDSHTTDLDKNKIKNIYTMQFEKIWNTYPRRIEKKNAYKCFNARLKEKVSIDDLQKAVNNYAAYCLAENKEDKFIKYPATFFGVNKPYEDWIDRKKIKIERPRQF